MPTDDERPHIGFIREPEIEPERRRRRGFGNARPVDDREAHGTQLAEQTEQALEAIAEERKDLGIAADRMLVIRFTSWDRNARDVFEERFGVFVVDEQVDEVGEKERTRVLVQFPSLDAIQQFSAELEHYGLDEQPALLSFALRRDFYDAMETVSVVSPAERTGPRLVKDGWPAAAEIPFDVDVWHPGSVDGARAVLEELRAICAKHRGRVVDSTRTETLILTRVIGPRSLGELLLKADIVSQVDLPARLGGEYVHLFDPIAAAPIAVRPDATTPVACVIDSGVLSGHPLLQGWVIDERDFGTDEATPADVQGHGTQVSGLAVYGDIAGCISTGSWSPRVAICSAKVLQRDPQPPHEPRFPDGRRPEALVEDAIRHFHRERGCRVFNLSAASLDEFYAGGRQFPWAETLDHLARELDVVIVVAAGNRAPHTIPGGSTRTQFQEAVRDLLIDSPEHRLTNPATASIALTVGAITRSDSPRFAAGLPGSPVDAPSPFTRLGPGYESKPTQKAVKPELVDYGGSLMVRNHGTHSMTWDDDIFLGEPTTQIPNGGRLVTAVSGTSFAAPRVTSIAAQCIPAITTALGGAPSANAIRAVLGSVAAIPGCGSAWLRDPNSEETEEKLRLVGYGVPMLERALNSSANDVTLVAEDSCALDRWQVYALPLPASFLSQRGQRGLVVSLAYDPPVRSSRRGYLARTMSIEVLKGLSLAEVQRFRTRHSGPGKAPTIPQSKVLDMRPTKEPTQWSTLQVRRYQWNRAVRLPTDSNGDALLHILVSCQTRFSADGDTPQRYALATRLWHSVPRIDLHQDIRTRVRLRVPELRVPVRVRS